MTVNVIPDISQVADGATNAFDMVFKGGVADLRPTPSTVIDQAPQRTVHRYLAGEDRSRRPPVLLVPPLAAPVSCFDLHRGCSMAAHFLGLGHPTYLLEYGSIAFSDRDLGLEHWVRDVVPTAIERVSDDAGGEPVQVIGWCLGGIMSLLSTAARPDLPINAVAVVASPFDFAQLRRFAPLRGMANITNGILGTAVYRSLGVAPAPLVKRAFQLSTVDKYVTKPLAVAINLHDREFLAQVEAVDDFIGNMHAYPGRTMGQLYHQFFRVNDLADGHVVLDEQDIDLADVDVPVLAIAGEADTLAPRRAVHHVGRLLTGDCEVELVTAPGGHLGVLTGRSAAGTTWRAIEAFFERHQPPTHASPRCKAA